MNRESWYDPANPCESLSFGNSGHGEIAPVADMIEIEIEIGIGMGGD